MLCALKVHCNELLSVTAESLCTGKNGVLNKNCLADMPYIVISLSILTVKENLFVLACYVPAVRSKRLCRVHFTSECVLAYTKWLKDVQLASPHSLMPLVP